MKIFSLFLFFTVSILSLPAQQVLYVDSAATGNNTGSSWANAYTDLQPALEAAQYGDQIWVAKGTYYPSKKWDGSIPNYADERVFKMRNGVKVFGGFSGNELTLSQRNLKSNKTILSGKPIPSFNGNALSVVFFNQCDSNTVLDGFWVNSGWIGSVSIPGIGGGGISINESDAVLMNLIIEKNFASGNRNLSAGICIMRSNPLIINCIIRDNETFQLSRGGGIGTNGSHPIPSLYYEPVFVNCLVINNHADDGGGGMTMADQYRPRLINVTFSGNYGPRGNEIYCEYYGSRPLLYNSIINGDVKGFDGFATFYDCLVRGSGGSTSWDTIFGVDGGGNIDTIPNFRFPTKEDFRLNVCSPAIGVGINSHLPKDKWDLDGDADYNEPLPIDLFGNSRIIGQNVDLGAIEGGIQRDTLGAELCSGSILQLGDSIITAPGFHEVYFPINSICDSIVVFNVQKTADATIAASPDSLTFYAVDSGASYQWYDCLNHYVLPADTNQSFTPWIPSSYQVIVTRDGCTDTSDCITVNKVGLEEQLQVLKVQVYPNPSEGKYHLMLAEQFEIFEIEVADMNGHLISKEALTETANATIDLTHNPAGIYLLRITTIKGSGIMRLVKY